MRHEAYLSSPREPVKEEEEKWAADRLKCASCRSGFSNEFIAMLLLCAGKDGLKSDAPMRLDARRISLAISAMRKVHPRLLYRYETQRYESAAFLELYDC